MYVLCRMKCSFCPQYFDLKLTTNTTGPNFVKMMLTIKAVGRGGKGRGGLLAFSVEIFFFEFEMKQIHRSSIASSKASDILENRIMF